MNLAALSWSARLTYSVGLIFGLQILHVVLSSPRDPARVLAHVNDLQANSGTQGPLIFQILLPFVLLGLAALWYHPITNYLREK